MFYFQVDSGGDGDKQQILWTNIEIKLKVWSGDDACMCRVCSMMEMGAKNIFCWLVYNG